MTMEDYKMNAIGINESRHLHPKYAIGWFIIFKTHYMYSIFRKQVETFTMECSMKTNDKNTLSDQYAYLYT